MQKSISSKASSDDALKKKSKRDYSIYDVLPAILDLKADALDLAKFKSKMPPEAARLVEHILELSDVAVKAAGSGDIADLAGSRTTTECAPANMI